MALQHRGAIEIQLALERADNPMVMAGVVDAIV